MIRASDIGIFSMVQGNDIEDRTLARSNQAILRLQPRHKLVIFFKLSKNTFSGFTTNFANFALFRFRSNFLGTMVWLKTHVACRADCIDVEQKQKVLFIVVFKAVFLDFVFVKWKRFVAALVIDLKLNIYSLFRGDCSS